MDALAQYIAQLGFPIVVCLLCFWYINKQSEQHKAEMDEVTKAIQNNTLALTQLIAAMDADRSDNQ